MPAPEEEALAEEVRELFSIAMREVRQIIEHGPANQRIPMLKSMMTMMAHQFGKQSSDELADARLQLMSLMTTMRGGGSLPLPNLPINAQSSSITLPANDTD